MVSDLPVLIVDDDVRFRRLVCELLNAHGYKTMEARSAAEATSCLGVVEPCLIICDYRLTDVDGLTWIGALRESGRNTPVVLISGTWLSKSIFDTARSLYRVSLVLRKPIVPLLFMNQLKNLLPRDSGGAGIRLPSTSVSEEAPGAMTISIENALDKVRHLYIKDLPKTWKDLKDAVCQAKAGESDMNKRAQALQQAHRLRGSAGSLGLNILGQIAGKIEDGLDWLAQAKDEGQQFIDKGLFGQPTETSESAQGELIPSKIIFLSSQHPQENLGVKRCVNGAVDLIMAKDVLDPDVASLPVGVLDAAILRAENTDELFELSRKLRCLPSAQTLPLALLTNAPDQFSPGELCYAGVSVIMKSASQPEIESTIGQLLNLGRQRKPRVVTVEDDETISQLVGVLLTSAGMLVCAVNEPIVTMNSLDEFKPDAVLLDINMQGLSGYDVCLEAMVKHFATKTEPNNKINLTFLRPRSKR